MAPKAHPAADLFPMLSDAALKPLVESMRERGFDAEQPILRYRGVILDGRNRLRAAAFAEVAPVFRDVSDDCDPWQESWSRNGLRRDLTPGQKAAILVKITAASAEWQTEREQLRRAANEARSEKAKAQHASSNPRAGESSGRASNEAAPNRTTTVLAAKAGVARSTVERALRLQKDAPEQLDAIIRGDKPERKKPPPRIDHEQRYADVLRLHEEGLGGRAIADKLGLQPSVVSKAKVELGVAANSVTLKLWKDIDHVTVALEGAAMKVAQLVEQLAGDSVFVADEQEIKRCIKSLSTSAQTVSRLRNALKQRCR